jgi:hypothetical protein
MYITQCTDEEFINECLVLTFKKSSIYVMVWACIIDGKKGPLIVLDYPGGKGGGMNLARYQEQVLDGVLLDFYTHLTQERGHIKFQQDGAPSHHSKSTRKWFSCNKVLLFPL